MSSQIVIKKLTEANLADYELLTKHGDDGKLCYCSFWHQKWASMDDYKKVQSENPERLKNCVIDRVESGFHVGVVAYLDDKPCAWVSVGPLTDFYWSWMRVAQLGEVAKTTAGILCFTVAPEFRGKGMQERVLQELKIYGKENGWTTIESYPFDDSAIEKHKQHVIWPGLTKGFAKAGFERSGPHWLSNADAERSIYQVGLWGL